MFEHVVGNIICTEFSYQFGRDREPTPAGLPRYHSHPTLAMQVSFSLSPDYNREDGYRHLTILIYGGGSNYISVYAKLDWNVTPDNSGLGIEWDEASADASENPEYTKGETSWVLLCHHDSCWRDSVNRLLWDYRERISSIDSLFNGQTGWYKSLPISEEFAQELNKIRRNTPGYGGEGERVNLSDLEFQFPTGGDQ
jgi:hypothetical protein